MLARRRRAPLIISVLLAALALFLALAPAPYNLLPARLVFSVEDVSFDPITDDGGTYFRATIRYANFGPARANLAIVGAEAFSQANGSFFFADDIQAQVDYSMEKVYYGYGWRLDSATGVRRQLVLLNLTEGYEESYPSGGLFSTFTQLFIEFSLPMNASGPEDGPGLLIRFSYHVDAICFQLSEATCPLGANLSATSQDVFELELRRILEYRDESY